MMRADDPSLNGDHTYMQMALGLAQEAYRAEEVPVGAILVKDGEILATGFNQRESLQDPTAHAELLAIRAAAEALGSWRLTGTTLYVTLEPCAMCAGAIIQSRVARLVFGTYDPKAGACGSICDLTAKPGSTITSSSIQGFWQTTAEFCYNNSFSNYARLNRSTFKNMSVGEVREWPIRTVSKTVVLKGTVGSNPTLSAMTPVAMQQRVEQKIPSICK